MMESIDKLREALKDCVTKAGYANKFDTYWITKASADNLIDGVEAEIAERYIELPTDADGVPIRPGDMIEYDYGDIKGRHIVSALVYDGSRKVDFDGGIWDFEFDDDDGWSETRNVNCMSDFYSCNRHVKPRTMEDVLEELEGLRGYGNSTYEDVVTRAAELAVEIRELMEGE